MVERCESISSSVLYDRLRGLFGAGLIEQDEHGAYRLTDLGRDLRDALDPLDAWAQRWANRLHV